MTYAPHFLLSFGGTLAADQEQWANNIRLGPPLGGTFGAITNPEGALDDIETDLRTLFGTPNMGASSDVKVRWIKLNEIGPDGRYANQSETHAKYLEGTEVFAGPGTPSLPPQCSVAVSWTTGRSRGPGSKGRVFVPRPSFGVDPAGRISSATVATMVTAWTTFIQNLNNWPGLDWPNSPVAVVASNVGAPGPMEQITGVRIGDVMDTQRRRRESIVETYQVGTV